MIQADEGLQRICTALQTQNKTRNYRSSLETWPPPVFKPPQCLSLSMEPTHQSKCTSLSPFVSVCSTEALWARLILDMKDFFSLITKGLNVEIQQDDRVIIFCNEDIPLTLCGDICSTEDYGRSTGDTGWNISDNNVISDFKHSTASQLHNPTSNVNRFLRIHDEDPQKSCQVYGAPRVLSRRDKKATKRKSVSFDDDVTVYLFDQETPTLELHTGHYTPLSSSYSCSPPDVTLEDIGLEWEDDFSALEKNCHFQHVRHSQHNTFSLLGQSCADLSRPEWFSLSQSCLFLTHVTESDLEQ
ncbi:uncharacterized protein LOC117829703 isoform X2 [Xyrichtys novacula]|nr:uncharacterized protein LOC117829703 isoform X2 [Xyrichtys novacula]